METWKTEIQICGNNLLIYYNQETQIPDKFYEKLQAAVEKNKPLDKHRYAEKIKKMAEEQFSISDLGLANYDEEENDDIYVERVTICDPGEQERFAAFFLGRKVVGQKTGQPHEAEFELRYEDYETIHMSVLIGFDENGVITRVGKLTAEGLQCGDPKYTGWVTCEPQYEYAIDELDWNALEEDEAEEDEDDETEDEDEIEDEIEDAEEFYEDEEEFYADAEEFYEDEEEFYEDEESEYEEDGDEF